MNNGPVETEIDLYCDFLAYKGGVYFPVVYENCGTVNN